MFIGRLYSWSEILGQLDLFNPIALHRIREDDKFAVYKEVD